MDTQTKIEILKSKINKAEQKGNSQMGVVRKWQREIRNLSK